MHLSILNILNHCRQNYLEAIPPWFFPPAYCPPLIEAIALSAAYFALARSGDICFVSMTSDCFLIILLKSRESFQNTSATIIYKAISSTDSTYSEEKGKVRHRHDKALQGLLHSPI